MPFVDNTTPPPEAGGALQRQKLLDGGFSQPDVQAWEQAQRTKQIAAGFTPDEMKTYWGDADPTTTKLEHQIAANVETAPKDAMDPVGMLTAGWQSSVLGIVQTHGKPTVQMDKNAPWWGGAIAGLGQTVGDLPTDIIGGIGGAIAGITAGAGVTAETGPGAAIGGAVGGVVGAGAGAGALTAAMREALLQSYNTTGPFDWRTTAQSAAKIGWEATKGAVTGLIGGLVGGAVGGKVVEATGSEITGAVANATSWGLASTATSAALDGKVPSAQDFVTGTILAIGLGAAGHWVGEGASKRFQPSPEGQTVAQNIQDIYQRTGITPEELNTLMKTHESIRQEVLRSRTAGGDQLTPIIDGLAQQLGRKSPKDFEPTPKSPYEPQKEEPKPAPGAEPGAETEPAPGFMKPEQVPQVQLDVFRELEGSADDAVSPAGAVGRYQIMPGTARAYGFDPSLLKDPAYNERAARAILADLNNQFKGNIADMAVAYNAGPGRARAWIRGGRDFHSLPLETQKYLIHAEQIGAIDSGFINKAQESALAYQGDEEVSGPQNDMPNPDVYKVEDPAEALDRIMQENGGEKPSEADRIAALSPAEANAEVAKFIAPQPELPSWAEKMNLGKAWRGFQFQLTGLHELDRALGKTSKEVGMEDVFRTSYGSNARADVFYNKGPIRLDFDEKGNPLYLLEADDKNNPSFRAAYQAVKKDGGNFRDFENYRLAARTLEKAEQGINTGLDINLARKVFNAPGAFEKYDRGQRILQDIKNSAVDYLVRSGVLSPDRAQLMKDLNQEHVVMQRAIYQRDYQPPMPGKTFGVQAPVKKMQGVGKLGLFNGGDDNRVVTPSIADMDNLNYMIRMADRNVALTYATDKIRAWNAANPDAQIPVELVKVSKQTAISEAVQARMVLEQKDADGNPVELPEEVQKMLEPLVNANELLRSLKKERGPNEPDMEWGLFRNGQLEMWRTTDPDLGRIFNSTWGSTGADPITGIVAQFAHLQRAGITSELSFPFRAVLHGQMAHAAFGEGGSHIPYGDIVHGLLSVVAGDAIGGKYKGAWDRFMANGGGNSAMSDVDRNMIPDNLSKIFKGQQLEGSQDADGVWRVKNPGQAVVPLVANVFRGPVEAFRAAQHLVHTTAQVGSMIAEERKGTSPLRAAMMARKGYLDYAEKFVSPLLNSWSRFTPFMATGFKDVQQVTQAMRDHPYKTSVMAAATLTLPTLINAYANRLTDQQLDPKDRYENLPAWLKDNYWVLPPINGVRLKIPKPYVGGALFASLPERFFNAVWDEEHGNGLQAGRDMDNWVQAMLGRTLPPVMPSLPTPILEQVTNHSFFTDRPLVSDGLARQSGYMQYGPNTSKTSIAIADFMRKIHFGIGNIRLDQTSPTVLDNYVSQWGGTAPSEFWHQVGDMANFQPEGFKKLGLTEGEGTDRPPHEAADWPIIGNFFVRSPGAGQAMDDFYTRAGQIDTAHADLARAKKDRNPEGLRAAMENPLTHLDMAPTVKALANMRALVNAANANTKLSDEEKLKVTDQLYTEMYQISIARVNQIDQALANASQKQ